MMRRLTAIMLAAAAMSLLAATMRWSRNSEFENTRVIPWDTSPSHLEPLPDDSIVAAANSLAMRDAFRLSREPAAIRYESRTEGASIPQVGAILSPTSTPRPVLVLRAIFGGPPWHAVIDGLPGQEPGTTVSTGYEMERLRVTSIARDSVVIKGADTTWILKFATGP